jgi:hypothetical protein
MTAREKTSGYRIIVQRDGAESVRAWRGKTGNALDAVREMLGYLADVTMFTITDVRSGEIIACGDVYGFTNSAIGPLGWNDF